MFRVPANRRVARKMGVEATTFLESACNSITRILPHVEAREWKIAEHRPTGANWQDNTHRDIHVQIGLACAGGFSISCRVQRRMVPSGVGAVQRTLDPRELEVCRTIASEITSLFADEAPPSHQVIAGLSGLFDELVIANHLKARYSLGLDPERLFRAFRALAEQTYENKPLAFGCIVDGARQELPARQARFPEDFLERKRYRALSDGYYTAYRISAEGAVVEFLALGGQQDQRVPTRAFFPEWCRDLAAGSTGPRVGFALTRNGDILVFDQGTLRFSYRFGRWQYWSHSHLVDLLKNSARVQRVPRATIPVVANIIYRTALDVAFRRTGGMFVVIRNRRNLGKIVRATDSVGNPRRRDLDAQFDHALPGKKVQDLPRSILAELASLDGAVVTGNQGELLAYGAVLEPKRKGRIDAEEGSRTKAAKGASNYGLAVKISSDGDITLFVRGREFIRV